MPARMPDSTHFFDCFGQCGEHVAGRRFPGRVIGQDPESQVQVATLVRKKIARLSALKTDEPVEFAYPTDDDLHHCLLVKTGEMSGGGIGKSQDIVAFSGRCSHMGGSMAGTYNGQHKVAGPCPLHLTTFDLTRHGMVVAGHATQALPQIMLELDGDDIYATGIVGLMYGYSSNA